MAKSAPPTSTQSPTVGKVQLTAKQALALTKRAPQDPHGWKEHGRHLFNADDLEGAKVALERAAKLDPTDHGIWLLLGYTLLNAGEESPAIARFEHALSLQNDIFEAHLNLAYLYLRRNETGTSITHIEKALSMQPNSTLALRVKAQLLTVSSKHEEAIEIFERLIRQDKTNTHDYWNDLGNIKREVVQLEDALDCYRKAAAYSGAKSVALSNQITLLHYMPDRDPSDILELCKRWGQTFTPRKTVVRPKPSNSSPDKVLRIAMLSDGFRQHPVGAMITPAISHLKRFGVQLYMYTSSSAVDSVTKKLMASADQWTSIFNISDGDLAQRIRNDQIDILIDLSGHNAGTRMKAIALEPAPVIVKWVGGLINTTGVPAIDYLITDPVESPPGSDAFYTEKLIRMPDDYICYMPPDQIPEVRSLPAQRNGFVTFGCFNNPTKVNDVVLGHWAELLHAVPGSHLYLKGGPFGTNYLRQRTLDTLASHGINADRVRIEGQSHHFELLDSYNEVDIALDPWPYSGGLTTCEAMLMGVPVITLPGPTFAGRHSATHLVNAGMPELVVSDWDEYQARAVGLASDLESLATIRSHLRRILLESPVCDGEKFGRHLGDALRAIWQRYCNSKEPASLAFTQEGKPWFEDEAAPDVLKHPVLAKPATETDEDFQFRLTGKIVVVDHGASFARSSKFNPLSALKVWSIIALDPASTLSNPAHFLHAGCFAHYNSAVALGDGNAAILYAQLECTQSSTMEPLQPDHKLLVKPLVETRIIAKIPIPTVELNAIHGLERIDWLVLDDRHDNVKILQHGGSLLKEILLIEVKIQFTPIFRDQTDLHSLTKLLGQHGFMLMQLKNQQYVTSFLPKTPALNSFPKSQLLSAEAVFVPMPSKLQALEKNQKLKLAFLLHSIYNAADMVAGILETIDPLDAEAYLKTEGWLQPRSDTLYSNFRKAGLKSNTLLKQRHGLPNKLVVSLTSYHKRFNTLHLTLRCLLEQSVKPDRLVLWIAETEEHLLPDEVLALRSEGIEIKFCDDIRSFKKIIPTLREESHSFIVTADDDLHYPKDWLKELTESWPGDPNVVVSWRAHKIKLGHDDLPIAYKEWEWEYVASNVASSLIFPTTGAGTLYPPGAFHPDVLNTEKFLALCPDADDVWLYWMCIQNGKVFKVVGKPLPLITWPGSQEESLWHSNLLKGENDIHIKRMISQYGFTPGIDTGASAEPDEIEMNLFSFSHQKKLVSLYLPHSNDHIQRSIRAAKNFYEIEMLKDIASRTPPGTTIIDIGANIGNHTVYFSLFCGAAKVLSFEPQVEIFHTLVRNIASNAGTEHVQAFNVGLGKEARRAKLGKIDEKNTGMTKIEIDPEGDITVLKLDDVITGLPDLPPISVVKIDVEGMELDVLKGAYRTVSNHRPLIYAEAGTEAEFSVLQQFFSPLGYRPTHRFNATATYLFAPG
ncbi:FkbM family methyltransferase [Achromobacter sp. LC458]|uniref:FkbM family methyltransferase n=1 Tax=Achromobacter sp. LC458 TaxID=1120623 RepID=UPI00069A5F23|nr:FkbM family methyltransferase [Achromobacter sp. LC458]TRM50980.1 FkbM family methyltransferase [Achromobacter sp. LC458]